jgi:hypothetical protein
MTKTRVFLIIGQTACHRRAPLDGVLSNASRLKHGVPIEELCPDAGSCLIKGRYFLVH